MRISILFGQRTESYSGEHAPEVLLAWDEFTREDNPEGWEGALDAARLENNDQMVGMKVIDIDVDGDKIRKLLIGDPVLKGTIKEEVP